MKRHEGDGELCFFVRPCDAAPAASAASSVTRLDEVTPAVNPPERAPLIYVVDDDAAFGDSLRWLLESAGYYVVAYPSAECFLAEYQPGAAACLLLDVRLPGMSGLALQQELNRRGESLPIIFISGHGGPAVAAEAKRNGAFEFLDKPVPGAQLLSAIEQTVARNSGVGPPGGNT